MNILVKVYKIIRMRLYNKRNHTNIRSLFASLDADFGRNVRIDEGTRVSPDVIIGDYSYVNHSSSLEHCTIGKFCSISSNVNICPYNHYMFGLTTHPIGDVQRQRKRTIIGNDVLISLNVVIMEGVHIGNGAVIGAGAVVTHNVGDFEVWGGVPAKFIHYRVVDENQRKVLSKLRWWDEKKERRGELLENYREILDGIENEL